MPAPEICACITSAADLPAAVGVVDSVSLYEVRIDLIGEEWTEVVDHLPRPWIACNRLASQGGACTVNEDERLASLLRALDLGATIVDIELDAPGLGKFVESVKGRGTLLVSHHDLERTEGEETLAAIVHKQRRAGADICKLVTTAGSVSDNVTLLRLTRRLSWMPLVAFAMGEQGVISRVLAPLAGARFTYASLGRGHEAAPGQLTVGDLRTVYDTMGVA